MFVNFADDLINPPELGIAEREIQHVKRGRFVLMPITDQTRGHATHSLPAVWKPYLAEVFEESQHCPRPNPGTERSFPAATLLLAHPARGLRVGLD